MAWSHTKIVGPAGSFGARYGLKIRKLYSQIKKLKKEKKVCPYCKSKSVKRIAAGIYVCRKCGAKFTGKAYTI